MMNIFEINKRIGQRPPFQMIEKVLELEPNVSARGIKNVSINEPYFMGHFPDAPIMPGVLIIESCAQLCSLVIDDGGKSREVLGHSFGFQAGQRLVWRGYAIVGRGQEKAVPVCTFVTRCRGFYGRA